MMVNQGLPWFLIFRGFIGFVAPWFFFYNIANISLAQAMTFSKTSTQQYLVQILHI